MALIFRRALSSIPNPSAAIATAATSAAGPSSSTSSSSSSSASPTSTLPRAVQRRRATQSPAIHPPSPLTSPESFFTLLPGQKTPRRLPDELEDRFQALRLKGQYKGDEASGRRAFLLANAAWRSRIRGVVGIEVDPDTGLEMRTSKSTFFERKAQEGEEGETSDNDTQSTSMIVGQRVYLPNVQIRLMRNHTPPGQAYDPWIATFRIPPSMTKNDLRSYLAAVYSLPVTFIRTDNYVGEVRRTAGGKIIRSPGSKNNYKRAVVGLTEPFHYPDDIEEMKAGTFGGLEEGQRLAEARNEVLDRQFFVAGQDDSRKRFTMKLFKGWRWRAGTHDNGGNTIREIMRRRQEREQAIVAEANRMRQFASETEKKAGPSAQV